jgi:hypothetical protein
VDRASGSGPEGRGFESLHARFSSKNSLVVIFGSGFVDSLMLGLACYIFGDAIAIHFKDGKNLNLEPKLFKKHEKTVGSFRIRTN